MLSFFSIILPRWASQCPWISILSLCCWWSPLYLQPGPLLWALDSHFQLPSCITNISHLLCLKWNLISCTLTHSYQMTLPFAVIQAEHLNQPCPFPSVVDLPHSQQEDLWILSPKWILNPLPSLHLHWQTASTVVRPPNVLPGRLQQPPDYLPTSLLAPLSLLSSFSILLSEYHKSNYFTSLFNHFGSFPDFLLWHAWSGPCLLLQFHFMSLSPHLLCSNDTSHVLLSFNIPRSFLSQGLGSVLSEWLTSFLLLIGS